MTNCPTTPPTARRNAADRRQFGHVALPGLAALTGCTHLGPGTIAVDRFDYGAAIGDSWTQQALLNTLAETDSPEKLPLITIPAQ